MKHLSSDREALFTQLYLEAFPAVARFISRKGGSLDEAKDIFQEGLVCFYEKVTVNDIQPKTNRKAYLLGICRNLWYNEFNRKKPTHSLEGFDLEESPDAFDETLLLTNYLQHVGQKCMDLLQSFYYENLSIKGLKDRFGFGSERSATVQKYKCLEKIREEVKQKSLTYEDFVV